MAELLGGMTPREVMERHTQVELDGWSLYSQWTAAEREKAVLEARSRQGRGR